MTDTADSFHSAAYLLNGEYAGKRRWLMSELSARWLSECERILAHYGPIFSHNMGSTLSHFDIRFTAGLAHYYSRGIPVLSAVYLSGAVTAQDEGALQVFVRQITTNALIARFCREPATFAMHLVTHNERPLSISVLWNPPPVEEADQEALMELANHLAGVYLCRYTRPGAA